MTPAGERGSFTFLIEAIGTGEDATGGVRLAFEIVTLIFKAWGERFSERGL